MGWCTVQVMDKQGFDKVRESELLDYPQFDRWYGIRGAGALWFKECEAGNEIFERELE